MTAASAAFRPPCWCPSRWAPTWRFHTNLYKFLKNVSLHIFHKKNCCDLNLGESRCISTFFLFPDSRLNLLNGFDFLFRSILNGVTLKTSNTNLTSFNLVSKDKLACRTGVIFCVFLRGTEAKARRARSASCVRGEDFLANLPSHATRGSRSLRACLAFAPVPLKYAKHYACSAG